MNRNVFVFFAVMLYVSSSYGSPGNIIEHGLLPDTLKEKIALENEIKVQDVHAFDTGTLSWSGGYVTALVFDDTVKNCFIYVANQEGLHNLFSGAPCEFAGSPQLENLRHTEYPDILYRIRLFSPTVGAMADEVVALFFSKDNKTYCTSQSLAIWYQVGNKEISPDLSDSRCLAEGAGY